MAADRPARFDRYAAVTADREIHLDHRVRARHRGVDIAITLVYDGGFGAVAVRKRGRLRVGIEQHRQVFDVDGNEIGGVFRDIGIGREHGGDWLADVAHALDREHRLAIGFEPFNAAFAEIDRWNIRDVGRGPHRNDSRGRARCGGVDRHDPTVRNGRPRNAHMQLMRKRDIARKAAPASHQWRILKPRHGLADIRAGLHGANYRIRRGICDNPVQGGGAR
jgi:hypothetical protein